MFGFSKRTPAFSLKRAAIHGGVPPTEAQISTLVWVVFCAPGGSGSIEVQGLPDSPEGWQRVNEICEGCDVIKIIKGTAVTTDSLRKRVLNDSE